MVPGFRAALATATPATTSSAPARRAESLIQRPSGGPPDGGAATDPWYMNLRFDRSAAPAALLAVVGALLALVSLPLDWYAFNASGVEAFLRDHQQELGTPGGVAVSASQIEQGVGIAVALAKDRFGDAMKGFSVFSPASVGFYVVFCCGVLLAAARYLQTAVRRGTLEFELLVAGVLIGFRPVRALFFRPDNPLDDMLGLRVVVPAAGVYVSLLGAGLILVAALMASLAADDGADAVARPEPALASGAVPAAAGPFAHTPYVPGPAYGAEGPSALGASSGYGAAGLPPIGAVAVAPGAFAGTAPAAAPHGSPAPAPLPPAPVAPVAAPAPAATRSGSVAPPGVA